MSSAVLDPRQMFPKEPVGTFPCSSSSSEEDETEGSPHVEEAITASVPHNSSPPPVSTPERGASATAAAAPQEYGPSLEAVRRLQSQYNRSLQVAEEQLAREVSPTTRRLTRLDVEVQPAKQLNIAGYGGMVSGVAAPVVSDDEGGEGVDDDVDEEEEFGLVMIICY